MNLLSGIALNCCCADPVVCVPSSFFIGDNGIPLEVIAGSVSAEELVTRIHKVKQVMLVTSGSFRLGQVCSRA